jgi:hypothetical protein
MLIRCKHERPGGSLVTFSYKDRPDYREYHFKPTGPKGEDGKRPGRTSRKSATRATRRRCWRSTAPTRSSSRRREAGAGLEAGTGDQDRPAAAAKRTQRCSRRST